MKDRAIELARQAGGTCFDKDGRYGNYQSGSVLFTPDEFKRFYQLARNDGVEAAEKLIKAIKTDRHDWEDWPRDSREAFKDAMEAK